MMDSPISQLKYNGQKETLVDLLCWIEQDISNYEIVDSDNLFDEDFDEILLLVRFNRGSENHQIVLTSEGFIRYYDAPIELLVDVHNSIVIFFSNFPVISLDK